MGTVKLIKENVEIELEVSTDVEAQVLATQELTRAIGILRASMRAN